MDGFHCNWCGKPIEQHKGRGRPRRYCSDACRVMACRSRRAVVPLVPDKPVDVKDPAPTVLESVAMARRAASDLGRAANHGPANLRAGCTRVAAAIEAALRAEGW